MITLDRDPQMAEQQMRAIIFYLTSFGYIDGEFDATERSYIRGYVDRLVESRARAALGDAPIPPDVLLKWSKHFHEVSDEVDREIQGHFTESVAEGEDTQRFVLSKLKLRCFELFKRFDEDGRANLLASVDELMYADGVAHPSETAFRDELSALLAEPMELDDLEIETVEEGSVIIGAAKNLAPREANNPFFTAFELDYADDPFTFAQQAEVDLALMRRFIDKLSEQRAAGAGRLKSAKTFGDFAGQAPFLDGHVYVVPPKPGARYELLVLGDLHGCYSDLKAALLQADFFNKVKAYRDDPANNPFIMLVLLGDYIDRGKFSYSGILRTVMQLFVSMPEHVFVLRGNHEYYIELNGRVVAPVRPAEAMNALQSVATTEVFAAYMQLFEALPNSLVFDRTLFVHAGIPREDTIAERFSGLESLNDPEIRFQMLWSDPSDADAIPIELQKASARFAFGRKQFRSFMAKLGCTTMIRGHERVVEGFRTIYDGDVTLHSLFSAGGATNDDLPETSNYREVTPMALTIRHEGGVSQATPFLLDYERYNDPKYNSFFRTHVAPPPPTIVI